MKLCPVCSGTEGIKRRSIPYTFLLDLIASNNRYVEYTQKKMIYTRGKSIYTRKKFIVNKK